MLFKCSGSPVVVLTSTEVNGIQEHDITLTSTETNDVDSPYNTQITWFGPTGEVILKAMIVIFIYQSLRLTML